MFELSVRGLITIGFFPNSPGIAGTGGSGAAQVPYILGDVRFYAMKNDNSTY